MKILQSFVLLSLVALLTSCDKGSISSLRGDTSPMAEVGVTVSSTSLEIAGVSSISGEVIGLEDGISVYSGTAEVDNPNYINILSNFPGTEVDGNTITISDIEFKQTTEGIASVSGLAEGIIVKYDAKVGDEYKTSDGIRTVVSRSTDDDYMYGFFLIKAIEIEESPNKYGVKKIRYWANHRFGLVGIEFTFDDNSTAKYPVFTSTQNG